MNYNPYSLREKTILITGASSGIGKTTAIECSKMGARLIITGRNNQKLDETLSQLAGNNHQKLTADLTAADELLSMISSLPPLDGVFSNAGIINRKPIQFISEKSLNDVMSINFTASVMLMKNLLKEKKLKNPSSVVFTSSITGVFNVSVGNSIYSASKGALDAFVKNAALDLSSKGIRCNSVNPAIIETELIESTKLSEEQLTKVTDRYPLKRLGKPEDVAHAVIYLLSDASNWVTGTNILIDGGYTLQ
ncbi:MAG: SDR family oxidoreductase [Balneolaceae bacterium]|nr:SDR family oxidoreductase [Balneolaceae bacterium]